MVIESGSKKPSGEKEWLRRNYSEHRKRRARCRVAHVRTDTRAVVSRARVSVEASGSAKIRCMRTVAEWKSVLRERLKESMRGKDARLVSMYRETLAAIDNAEAPAVSQGPA